MKAWDTKPLYDISIEMGNAMEHIHSNRQKIIFEIEHLPNPYLTELQNFIQYLKYKQSDMAGTADDSRFLPPEADPVLRAFGMIDVTPFSETVDDILYGTV